MVYSFLFITQSPFSSTHHELIAIDQWDDLLSHKIDSSIIVGLSSQKSNLLELHKAKEIPLLLLSSCRTILPTAVSIIYYVANEVALLLCIK